VAARFFSRVPHPHLLGVCRPNRFFKRTAPVGFALIPSPPSGERVRVRGRAACARDVSPLRTRSPLIPAFSPGGGEGEEARRDRRIFDLLWRGVTLVRLPLTQLCHPVTIQRICATGCAICVTRQPICVGGQPICVTGHGICVDGQTIFQGGGWIRMGGWQAWADGENSCGEVLDSCVRRGRLSCNQNQVHSDH
jgi:hypothetical protein